MKKLKPKENFLLVPNPLIERYVKPLGNSAFVVFLILYHLAHRYGNGFYHSDQQITEKYEISLSMLRRGRKVLREKGFLYYKSGSNVRFKATKYKILPSAKLREEFRMEIVFKMDSKGTQIEQ